MSLPAFINDRIYPYTESFKRDLEAKLHQIDAEASANGALGGSQLRRYQQIFIEKIKNLLEEIQWIILDCIKNKTLIKPAFSILRQDIQSHIQPLINDFESYFTRKIRQAIPQEESANGVLVSFNIALQNNINKQFVNFEQAFDSLF